MKYMVERVREYINRKTVRARMRKVISILCCVVVFVTTYALVLPSLALEKTAICGKEEHEHSADCYTRELVCGQEESEAHQHTDECYEDVLTCGKEVHVHTLDCYEAEEPEEEEPAQEPEEPAVEETAQEPAAEETDEPEETTAPEETVEEEEEEEQETPAVEEPQEQEPEDDPVEEQVEEKSDSGKTEKADKADTSKEEKKKEEVAEPEKLGKIDFADLLTNDTDVFYLPENAGSDDWEAIDGNVKLDPEETVILHIAYEIPAGKLNATNMETEYYLPIEIAMSDKEVEAVNKYQSTVFDGTDRKSDDLKKAGEFEIEEKTNDKGEVTERKLVIRFNDYAAGKVGGEKLTDGTVTAKPEKIEGFLELSVSAADLLTLEKVDDAAYKLEWNDDDRLNTTVHFDEEKLAAFENQDKEETADETAKKDEKEQSEKKQPEKKVVIQEIEEEKPAETEAPVQEQTEETAKTEEAAEEAKYASGRLKYDGGSYTVTADFDESAKLPEGVQLKATELQGATYDMYLNKAQDAVDEGKEVTGARFFDITFVNTNGEPVEPQGMVDIKIQYKNSETIDKDANVEGLHFTEEGAENVDVETKGIADNHVDVVTFQSDSFSVYGIVYTVDFTYSDPASGNEYNYSLKGNGSINLTELLVILGIKSEDEVEKFVAEEVVDVKFSNTELVKVTHKGKFLGLFGTEDWLLESLQPFDTEETLTIMLRDGGMITIKVTDEQGTDIDLNNTLSKVTITIDGQEFDANNPGNTFTFVAGKEYKVHLQFQENEDHQFVNDDTEMVYTLPAGVSVGNTSGEFSVSFPGLGKLEGNTYRIVDNKVYVKWNTTAPEMRYLRASDVAKFGFDVQAMFDNNAKHIEWSTDITSNIDVNEPHEAHINKTGTYNAATDSIDYTVVVTSEGRTSGIKITDTITGTALKYKVNTVNDIKVFKTNKDGIQTTVTIADTDLITNPERKTFELHLPDMVDGDKYEVKYSAEVDYTKLSGNGKTKYDETNNGVELTYEETPTPETDNSYAYDISLSSFNKTATNIGDVQEDSQGKFRLVTYKITANDEKRTPVSHIFDAIRSDSRNRMTMTGDRITVIVSKTDGTTENRVIPWGTDSADMGRLVKTDYTWDYYPPASDGKASYEITYQTRVDMNGVTTAINVNNDAGDDYSGSGTGAAITPGEGDGIALLKTATSVDEKNVEWKITLTVPKGGLSSAVVTDVLPHNDQDYAQGGYFDSFASAGVDGLLPNESYKITKRYRHKYVDAWNNIQYSFYVAEEPTDPEDIETEVYFTFYKPNGEEGLIGSGDSRIITITITTENNQKWLEAAESNYWSYYQHTNTAKIGNITASAVATPSIKKIQKTNPGKGTLTLNDGETYNYYKYELVLQGVTRGDLEIFDTFDTDVFEILNVDELDPQTYQDDNPFNSRTQHKDTGHGFIWDMVNNTTVSKLDEHVARFTTTPNGVIISTDGLDMQSTGAMYPSYKIIYYLVMKHPEVALQKAKEAGGKITFNNKVDWDGAKSDTDVEFGKPIIDKTAEVTEDEILGNVAKYTIVINPDKLTLNNGEKMEMTDTFNQNLSIIYDSIKVVTDPAGKESEVTYDYYGNTGVFQIPDSTKVTIKYTCKIIGTGNLQIYNKAKLEGGYEDEEDQWKTIDSSGEGEADVFAIKLLKYKSGDMQEGSLAGATFRILDSEKNPIKYSSKMQNTDPDQQAKIGQDITFETTADGAIMILLSRADHGVTLKKNTVYYLEEIEAPPGFQLDTTLYSFAVSNDHNSANYTREDGVYVYYVGDILKIRNTPEKQQLVLTKRFAGNIALTDEQKAKIHFDVIQVDENGDEITGGFKKLGIRYSDLKYDKYTIEHTDEQTSESGYWGDPAFGSGYYKVIEYQDDMGLEGNVIAETTYSVNGQSGPVVIGDKTAKVETITPASVSDDATTNVIFTNTYSTGAYFFTKLEAGTDQPLPGAEFTVYRADDDSHGVTTYTTGVDGRFSIARDTAHMSTLDADTLYYVVETKAPEGFIIPDPATKYYFYFGTEGAAAPEGAAAHNAINLGSTNGHETVLNASETSVLVEKKWKHADGTDMTDEELKDLRATVTLRRRAIIDGSPVEDEEFSDTQTLNNQNDFYYLWDKLDKVDDERHLYKYYVVESASSDFAVAYSANNEEGIEVGTITVTNTKLGEKGSVKVTKNFEGITADQIPAGFKITASWIEEGTAKTAVLTISGTLPDNVTMTGSDLSYEWTISELPIGTEVEFKESGYDVTGYIVTVTGSSTAADKSIAVAKAALEPGVARFVNTYDRSNKGFEFTKIWKNANGTTYDEWQKDITVDVSRRKTGETVADDSFKLTYEIKKNAAGTVVATLKSSLPAGLDSSTYAMTVAKVGTGTAVEYKFTIGNVLDKYSSDSKEWQYYVTEESRIAGYQNPKYGRNISGQPSEKSGDDADKAFDGEFIINVPEDAVTLPESGGIGTTLFTILGSILSIFAAVMLYIRRQRLMTVKAAANKRMNNKHTSRRGGGGLL